MSLVSIFVGAAILLGIAVTILGSTSSALNCDSLSGNATSGWQGTCNAVAAQSQSSFNLLVVILIVVAAVAILIVVRML